MYVPLITARFVISNPWLKIKLAKTAPSSPIMSTIAARMGTLARQGLRSSQRRVARAGNVPAPALWGFGARPALENAGR